MIDSRRTKKYHLLTTLTNTCSNISKNLQSSWGDTINITHNKFVLSTLG